MATTQRAIGLHEASLEMHRAIYGQAAIHPHIVNSLNNLAKCQQSTGNYAKAIGLFEASVEMQRAIYGQDANHPDIAGSLKQSSGLPSSNW